MAQTTLEETYTHVESVPVRYRDLDTMAHANNAVVATYCEEGRVGYFRELTGGTFEEWFGDMPFVLASLTIDFRASVRADDDVAVGVSITDVGRTSFTMVYEVRAGEDVAAEAESVQVAVDPETRETRPIPEEWRRTVAEVEGEAVGEGGDEADGTRG
jgi:acyl-CoA thioester hydrolase